MKIVFMGTPDFAVSSLKALVEEAMLLLHQIMVTKKAGREEVERRFLQLMEETETEGMLSEFVKEHILKDNKVELC